MADTKFKRGAKKPANSGRKKGVKNKFTINIKEMVLDTLNDERVGGLEGFIKWVIDTKRNKELFYTWLMKMLPSSLVGEQDDKGKFKPLKVIVTSDGNKPDNPT